MSTLPDRDRNSQASAVEIVVTALRVLRTRDGINIPDALVDERARNAVAALEGAFELVPHGLIKLARDLREGTRQLRVAAEALGITLNATEAGR